MLRRIINLHLSLRGESDEVGATKQSQRIIIDIKLKLIFQRGVEIASSSRFYRDILATTDEYCIILRNKCYLLTDSLTKFRRTCFCSG
jgi:hypothetical protein